MDRLELLDYRRVRKNARRRWLRAYLPELLVYDGWTFTGYLTGLGERAVLYPWQLRGDIDGGTVTVSLCAPTGEPIPGYRAVWTLPSP